MFVCIEVTQDIITGVIPLEAFIQKDLTQSPAEPALAQIASCGKGRGQTINEKLKDITAMGPASSSWYTRSGDSPKKPVFKKPAFPSREEQEAR